MAEKENVKSVVRRQVGWWLRRLADRVDDAGAPKRLDYSFTFEHRQGIVFRSDDRGCPLWFVGDRNYRRAHAEADTDHAVVDWRNGRSTFGRPQEADWRAP